MEDFITVSEIEMQSAKGGLVYDPVAPYGVTNPWDYHVVAPYGVEPPYVVLPPYGVNPPW